jgi:hypothetical protein
VPVFLECPLDVHWKYRILVVVQGYVISRWSAVNSKDSVSSDLPESESRSAISKPKTTVGPIT